MDAISAVEPFITSAELSIGAEPVMSTCTGPTANFPMSGYFSTQKWAQTYPNTARAFQAAMARGQALADASRSSVEQILPAYIKSLSPEESAVVNLGQFPTSLNATHLARVVSLMINGGLLSPQFSVDPHAVPLTLPLPLAATAIPRAAAHPATSHSHYLASCRLRPVLCPVNRLRRKQFCSPTVDNERGGNKLPAEATYAIHAPPTSLSASHNYL